MTRRLGLLLVGAYALARGLFLVEVVPPWQGPDEPGHAEVALLLAQGRPAAPEGDPAVERAILASMAAHDFYRRVGVAPPSAPPAAFADVPRLGGEPTQLQNETPVGYAPYALAAALGGPSPLVPTPSAVEAALWRMRLVSVVLVLATLAGAAWAAREVLGAPLVPATVALVGAAPMLGFAGAIVNNDLPAAALAATWWALLARAARRGLAGRELLGLLALALAAGLAKRTALYLIGALPAAVALLVVLRRGAPVGDSAPPERPGTRTVAGAVALVGVAALVAAWPVAERAAGWSRVGAPWGAERSPAAARSGGFGLHVEDRAPDAWQYLAQTVSIPGGGAVRASVWLRAAGPGGDAHVVVSDDRGTWLGRTVALDRGWQEVRVEGELDPAARHARLAVVPSEPEAAGMGAVHADDAALVVAGADRLANGGAEAPRRVGGEVARWAATYLDLGRVAGAPAGVLADPARVAARAARGLAFTFESFWGGFGWLTIWPPAWHRRLAAVLTVFVLAAVAVALVAPSRLAPGPTGAALLRTAAVGALLAICVTVAGLMAGAPPDRLPQGRYLVAALVPLALPAVALADRLWPRVGPAALALVALGLDAYGILVVLWPTVR